MGSTVHSGVFATSTTSGGSEACNASLTPLQTQWSRLSGPGARASTGYSATTADSSSERTTSTARSTRAFTATWGSKGSA